MRANYEGSEILNEVQIKIAQFLNFFCTDYCFETLSLVKSVLPLLLTLTHQLSLFFVYPFTGLPSQKFNSIWVEPFIFLRKATLSLSFGLVRIR